MILQTIIGVLIAFAMRWSLKAIVEKWKRKKIFLDCYDDIIIKGEKVSITRNYNLLGDKVREFRIWFTHPTAQEAALLLVTQTGVGEILALQEYHYERSTYSIDFTIAPTFDVEKVLSDVVLFFDKLDINQYFFIS